MSAIAAAQYPAPAVSVPDARYAAHYDPSTFFSYSPPSLSTVSSAALDAQYTLGTGPAASGASYIWDAHEPAVQSPASAYSSSASANAYHSAAAPASSGHSSVTASFAYTAHQDYANVPSHRAFPSSVPRPTPSHHHPSASASAPSSSAAAAASHASSSTRRHSQSYSSGARSYSSLAAASTHASASSTTSTPRLQNASWDSAALYTIDPAEPISHASPQQHAYSRSTTSSVPATPVSPPIKEEDPEGEFIIEVSVPADPVPSSMPEVPLRATHAPPKMRSMMCSFRLESFAMHDGIRSAATQPGPGGIVVGPLREKPIEFEWQADLVEPLVPQEEDAFRYGAAQSKPQHAQAGYAPTHSPPSSRRTVDQHTMSPRRSRAEYVSTGTASPALSLDYPHVDNDAWDASSGYGSGSGTAASASPTFAPIMTPAQSLGWSLRYQAGGESEVESSGGYQRQSITQPSLSRVSQSTSRYMLGNSGTAKASYHHQSQPQQQQAQYGYDNGGYSTRSGGSAARYGEVYASSGSSSGGWYR